MNDMIQRMKRIPGRHACTTPLMWIQDGMHVIVEVDKEGRVFQLDRNGERDGELPDDGWSPAVIVLEIACLTDTDPQALTNDHELQRVGNDS